MNNQFKKVKENYFKRLEQFVPIVDRVHGSHHPEFHDVRRVFNNIGEKVKNTEGTNLKEEFLELRKITDNYKVPTDVCETYEAVYNMLEELDKAYFE